MNYGQTFMLTITADGAAFEDDPQQEIADNLRAIAEQLEFMPISGKGKIIDHNGNTCGRIDVLDYKPKFVIGE